jgi:CheY-like chemotaxis protein
MMGQEKHILVVDDNDDVRDVIVDTLVEYRYRVSAASGGSEMRDLLQTGDTVDCVVLDVLMPGEANPSLVLYLKERNIPVIIISGSSDLVKYAADNDLQLLRKPFRLQDLHGAVIAALGIGEFGRMPPGREDATMPGWYVSYLAGAVTVMSLAKSRQEAVSAACDLLDRKINVQEIGPLLGMRDPGDIIGSVEIRRLHGTRIHAG